MLNHVVDLRHIARSLSGEYGNDLSGRSDGAATLRFGHAMALLRGEADRGGPPLRAVLLGERARPAEVDGDRAAA